VTAIVLAGGRGTRLASLHPNIPKPLVPVAGEPFLYWLTGWLAGQGLRDFVFSVGYLGEQIERWLARQNPQPGYRLICRREESELGTGGAVLHCLDLCADTILIVNGDTLVLADIAQLMTSVAAGQRDGAILGVRVADASRYGSLEIDDHGMLGAFAEKRPGEGIVNAGVLLLKKSALDGFARGEKLSLENDILPDLLRNKQKIAVHVAEDAPFLDIGTPESAAQADDFIARNRASLIFPFTRGDAS
jgi:D-glycero-alpha-D-manno-heptose 1-phosphate guanylyltransferase